MHFNIPSDSMRTMPFTTSSPAVSPMRTKDPKDSPSTKAPTGLNEVPYDKMSVDEKIAYAREFAERLANDSKKLEEDSKKLEKDSAKLKKDSVKLQQDVEEYCREAKEDREKRRQNLIKLHDEVREERAAWENMGVLMTTVAVAAVAARSSHSLQQNKYRRTCDRQ